MKKSPIAVDLIILGTSLEPFAIRSTLEAFNIDVRCHFVGHVKKLISLLNGEESLHDIVILSCHGNDQGMTLPELHEDLEKEMPYHRILTASDCGQFLRLHDQLIINTGCCLGQEDFAKVFLEWGALTYIGFNTEVEGNAALFFVISLLYFFIQEELSLSEAFAKAMSSDKETGLARIYCRKG